MTRQRAWVPFTLFALLALLALFVSGLHRGTIRAFALGVPSAKTVAVAGPGRQVCEGPIRSQEAFQSVVLSGRYVSGKPLVRIWGAGPSHPELISAGPVEASGTGVRGPYLAMLSTAVDRGVSVKVCVVDAGGELELQGYKPGYGGAAIAGSKRPLAFSVVLMEPGKHSFLSSLSLAFSRASLFRPSWVGRWTFWALLIALLGVVPIGAVAISAAIRSEEDQVG
jgi:hypothetical protein